MPHVGELLFDGRPRLIRLWPDRHGRTCQHLTHDGVREGRVVPDAEHIGRTKIGRNIVEFVRIRWTERADGDGPLARDLRGVIWCASLFHQVFSFRSRPVGLPPPDRALFLVL